MAPPVPPNRRLQKYLCSAPRPEHWNDYTLQVLRKIGSTPSERKARLVETIQAARSMHPDSIKTHAGPGRKSNAEHAIVFYEYLLSRAAEDIPQDEEEEEDVVESKPLAYKSSGSTTISVQTTADDPVAQINAETLDLQPQETLAAQHYPHNDYCEVCGDTQQRNNTLVLCWTCPRSFHADCHRPPVMNLEEAGWRCSYCILASEPKTTKSRASKARRSAAGGVRLMARYRNQRLGGGGGGTSENKQETKVTSATRRVSTRASSRAEGNGMDVEEDNEEVDETNLPEENVAMELDDTKQASAEAAVTTGANDEPVGEDANKDLMASPPKQVDTSNDDDANDDVLPDEAVAENKEDMTAINETPEPSDEKAIDDAVDAGNEEQEEDSKLEQSPSSKKVTSALQKLASPTIQVEPDAASATGGRARRNRKQPALYDPQTVPAREWVSDEVQHSQSKDEASEDISVESDADEESDSEIAGLEGIDLSYAIQRKRRAKVNRDGNNNVAAWCHFCNDDLAIPLCCFCGCRSCFTKHGQDRILLCETCNDEYHASCLDPPIEGTLPLNWNCPPCSLSQDKRVAKATTKRRMVLDKNRESDSPEMPRRSPSPRRTSMPKAVEAVTKRGPGRPRKSAVKRPEKRASTTTGGKKRGRPPKSSRSSSEPPRKRGRPPKSASVSPSDGNVTRNRGRLSDPIPDSALDVVEAIAVNVEYQTTSRSGRTVKRSSFHDEIGHGEQHLRVYRDRRRDGGSAKSSVIGSTASIDSGVSPQFGPAHGESYIPNLLESHEVVAGVANVAAPTPANTPMPLRQVESLGHAPSVTETLNAAAFNLSTSYEDHATRSAANDNDRVPRRKPGARECMQMSRRFGPHIISDVNMQILFDYCQRGKVEHLIRMRERLDEHARFLETQLAGLESAVKEKGESDVVVPAGPAAVEDRSMSFG